MSQGAILAIDQGTTNTKALLLNLKGEVIVQASVPLTQKYPQAGWVEQDLAEIWQSVQQAIDGCIAQADEQKILAVAISNQRETATAWNRKTGEPFGPAIGWQCRRTAQFCEELRTKGLEEYIHEKTGLNLDPLFSGTKFRWFIDNLENGGKLAENGEICFGNIDAWLLWNLTGGKIHATDVSNASRTQLFNIRQLCWDTELLEFFGIPLNSLPEVKPSTGIFGKTVSVGKLPADIPIAAMIGDSHAALFGQLGFKPGVIKATYGTGSSLMTPVPQFVKSKHGLSTTIAWQIEGQDPVYGLEGNIPISGAAIEWLGEFLGFENSAEEVAKLAETAEREEGLYIVPAFVGLGSPHWNPLARGLITGINRGTKAKNLALATLEAVAYQIRDVFEAMQSDVVSPLKQLLADGGAAKNKQLMQFQADILGCQVLRNDSAELSAIGAAYLAGLAIGIWSSVEEIENLIRVYHSFEPSFSDEEREKLYKGWKDALVKAQFDSKLID